MAIAPCPLFTVNQSGRTTLTARHPMNPLPLDASMLTRKIVVNCLLVASLALSGSLPARMQPAQPLQVSAAAPTTGTGAHAAASDKSTAKAARNAAKAEKKAEKAKRKAAKQVNKTAKQAARANRKKIKAEQAKHSSRHKKHHRRA